MPGKITKDKAIKWINENFPKYEILSWGENAGNITKFYDKERKVEFNISFSQFKKKMKYNPNKIWNPSKEERKKINKDISLKKYGVDNPFKSEEVKQKIKETNLKKYQTEHPFQNKKIQKKFKKTCLKRYGVEWMVNSKEFKEKLKQTNIKKYGVDNPFKSKEIQIKIKETNLEKYGVKNPFANKKIQEKIKQTNLEKYGVKNPLESSIIKNKVRKTNIKNNRWYIYKDKSVKEWAQNPNAPSETTFRKAYHQGVPFESLKSGRSNLEIKVKQLLEEQNINFIHDKILSEHEGMKKGFKRPDFLLPDYNLIIECDGEYWHQNKEKDKERNKIYRNLGYKVLCFSGNHIQNNFDYVKYKIINKLKILKYFKEN